MAQSNVATVIRWGGQNYSHLHQVSFQCCVPNFFLNRPMFHAVIQKIIMAPIFCGTV